MADRIIFPLEFAQRPSAASAHAAPLLQRMAMSPDGRGNAFRDQLERAAQLVPNDKRTRVLGPLLKAAASDDQVRSLIGVLLLAKMLSDHGWSVEFEPDVDGKTPDLRVVKGVSTFIIEARRIASPLQSPEDAAVARIRDALERLPETTTPISIRRASADGGASLKPFVRYLKTALAAVQGGTGTLDHQFHEGGVFVAFEIHTFSEPWPLVFGLPSVVVHGSQRDEVRNALDEKLMRYKVPIIVALDFFDFVNPFATTEDVVLGRRGFQAAFDPQRGIVGSPQSTRLNDSALRRQGADGARARARLQAVLPFGLLGVGDGSFEVRARIITNPAPEAPLMLREFSPIPRLVVTGRVEGEKQLSYRGGDDSELTEEVLNGWRHVP